MNKSQPANLEQYLERQRLKRIRAMRAPPPMEPRTIYLREHIPRQLPLLINLAPEKFCSLVLKLKGEINTSLEERYDILDRISINVTRHLEENAILFVKYDLWVIILQFAIDKNQYLAGMREGFVQMITSFSRIDYDIMPLTDRDTWIHRRFTQWLLDEIGEEEGMEDLYIMNIGSWDRDSISSTLRNFLYLIAF